MSIRYVICLLFVMMATTAFAKSDLPTPPDAVWKGSKCLVSGLPANDNVKWVVLLNERDGSWKTFVGMKNFLEYVNFPDKFVGKQKRHSGDVWVRDNKSKKWIPALFAYFVIGDNIHGAVGRDAIPFEDEKAAQKFMIENKGRGVVRMLGLKRSIYYYLKDLPPDTTESQDIIIPKVIEQKNAPTTGK